MGTTFGGTLEVQQHFGIDTNLRTTNLAQQIVYTILYQYVCVCGTTKLVRTAKKYKVLEGAPACINACFLVCTKAC